MAVARPRSLHVLGAALVLALAVTLLPATPAEAADSRNVEQIQTIVERKINRARTSRGLRPLKVHRRLEYWATDHARHMARNRTLMHDSLSRLMLEAPPRAVTFAENIARNRAANAARRSHRMFMRSAPHRANILDRRSTHMGIGVVKRGRYTYIVQRFARIR